MPSENPKEDLPVWNQALSSPVFEAVRPSFESFKLPELPPKVAAEKDLKRQVAWIAQKTRILGKARPLLICFAWDNLDPKNVRPKDLVLKGLFERKRKVALAAQCFRRVWIDTSAVEREQSPLLNRHEEGLVALLDTEGGVTLVGPGGIEPQTLLEGMRKALGPERELDLLLEKGEALLKDLQELAKGKAALLERRRRLKGKPDEALDRLEKDLAAREEDLLRREKELFR